MVKALLLIAFTANAVFLAASSGSSKKCAFKNEVYDPCPSGCPPRICGINDASVSCTQGLPVGHPDCPPAICRCKSGFYRNYNGTCVRWENCPKCNKPNEIYDQCPAPCPPRRCDVNEALILCAVSPQLGDPECEPGCRCKDGYVKNASDVCIPKDQCPRCPNPNEVYDPCIAPCPPRRCDVDNQLIKCAAPPKLGDPSCEAGCRCADGYKEDYEGVCIPEDQCPKCTQPHEVYDPCPSSCPPQTCKSIGKKYHCPNNNNDQCYGQCVCEIGYFRNLIGQCISKDNCLKCSGPHEFYSCGPACDNVCGMLNQQNQTNCPIVNKVCNNKCYCEEGYARNENNICIPIKNCKGSYKKLLSVPRCGPDERYEVCPQSLCQPLTCSEVGNPIDCPDSGSMCPGKPACICKDGLVRNDKGVCVPRNSCPSCGNDPNKVAGCGVYCNQRCRDIGEEPGFCILPCYENACNCKKGYYLDENTGECVLSKDCTPQCGINERYDDCIQGYCGPKSCSQVGFPISCLRIDPKYCKKGCLCKEGYVRNYDGVCIPLTECPSCGGDRNATSGCGGYCNKRCSDVGRKPGACALSCILNGCDCKSGYYFDKAYQKCVKPEDCSNSPTCSAAANEVYSDCINGGCQPKNCSQYGQPIRCVKIDPKYCIKGCLCKDGYLRDTNGNCVLADNCPEACNQPNEEYNECSWDCPPQTCESLDKSYACPLRDGDNCKPMCRCKPGYYRNKIGMCITEEQCRRCMGPHEYFSCGGACDNVCDTLSEQSQDNCPIINIKCNEMCYCEKDYARAYNGTCIPIDSCDITAPQCSTNEFYSECIQGNCSPQTCSQIGFPMACPSIDSKYCKEGCLCKEGYVRNKKGICIPSTRCPSCGGDPNAEYSNCGGNCLKKCYDLQNPDRPRPCPKICLFNSCECKKGYYFDEYSGQCVFPENCSPTCGIDEVYSSCVNGGCDKRNCSQLNSPQICIDPLKCYEGCICKEGYLRNDSGTCVPNDQCPTSCNGDPNAKPGCGINCGKQCHNNLNPKFCPRIQCKPDKCDCKDGFVYDPNIKKCVRKEQCSPACNELDNEVYDPCINAGCGWKNCSQVGGPVLCVDVSKCYQGCSCKEGYYRLDGTCVTSDQCPSSCNGDPNAEPGCGLNCNKHCSNINGNTGPCPRIACPPNGCECKPGFYLNPDTKMCVEPNDCCKFSMYKNY